MEGALPSSLPMRASRWPTVLMVVGAGVVAAFQIGKAPAALPVLRADLGLSLVAAGWVISMFNVIGMAVGMIAGAAADRIGHRRVVLMGLGLVAAASLAGAGANGAGVLLLGRFFEGLGFIGVVVAAPVLLIGATSPRDLGLAFGVWGGYMPTGTALMLLASPVLLAPFGWRGLWLANGALAAVFALALAAATRDLGRPPAAPPGGGARALSGDIRATVGAAGPVTLALAFASYTLQFLAVLGFLPTILVEQEGFSQALAAALTSFAVAVNVAGNLAAGFLIQRGVPRWALMATASAAMALCSVGIYDPGLAFATRYGLCVLLSLIGGLLPAAVLGAVPVFAPAPRLVATTSGLIMQGSNLGQMIGPPAVAELAAALGDWRWSPLILAGSALAGVALSFVLRGLERPGVPTCQGPPQPRKST